MNKREKEFKTPRITLWLLNLIIRESDRRFVIGDLCEIYRSKRKRDGSGRAYFWLLIEILRSLPEFVSNTIYWRFLMILNYLKTAFRIIKRHKGFSFINIAGLAVGFACSILIALYVINELSYDFFHEKADRIYRITLPDDVSTPPALAPIMQAAFPQVEAATGFANLRTKRVQYQDRVFYEFPIRSATNEFFSIFSFQLINGDGANALKDPNTVVLTKSMAVKYFDNEVPLGKMITIGEEDYRVDGVLEDIPENSHLSFACLVSNNSFGWFHDNIWGSNWMATYILVQDQSDEGYIESKLPELITTYIYGGDPNHNHRFIMQPLTSIHLHSDLRFELGTNGDFKNIIIFSTVAILMIILACINFANLTTARSITRLKEIGIRKTIGSSRKQLIHQFLGESIFMSLLAMVLGLLLVFMVLPVFYQLIGRQISLEVITPWIAFPGLVCFSVLVGLLAGCYPAFYLSSFQPVKILKGILPNGKTAAGFRNGMVIFQFIVSIVLLVGTFTVYRQLHYIQSKDLGFEKNQVLILKNLEPDPLKSETLKQKLLQHKNIVSVSSSGNLPGEENGRQAIKIEDMEPTSINLYSCDYDFMETLQLEMVEGRFFSKDYATDTAGIILNEHAVKAYNLENPLGKRVTVSLGRTISGPVIGVVKDFHYRSLHEQLGSMAMVYGIKKGWGTNYVSIRLNTDEIGGTIEYIKETWESVNKATPFDYTFLNEAYSSLYTNEQTTGRTVMIFCLLAIVVCCLGLYGLSSFVIERRVKEIGIRKIVGASIKDIVWLLSRSFLRWILLAFILAVPLAWIIMGRWLQNFAYRIELEVWVFAVSGALALLIAFLTVGFQSLKVALANPVKSLRDE